MSVEVTALTTNEGSSGCIFCRILSGQAPGHILFTDENMCVIMSLEGHPLVIPHHHAAYLEELDDTTGAALFNTAKRVAAALRAATKCEGVNLILSDGRAAGQDVFHVHLHVKPRWAKDDVRLEWDTTTLPEMERRDLAERVRELLGPS